MVAISSFSRQFQVSLTVMKYLNWDFRDAEKIGLGKAEKPGGTVKAKEVLQQRVQTTHTRPIFKMSYRSRKSML